MFGKLFKYEFLNVKKYGFPLILGVLGAGALAWISIFFFCSSFLGLGDFEPVNGAASIQIISIMCLMLLSVVLIAIAVSSVALAVILIVRYYNSMTKDEAYLTFTLPVRVTDIIWTKILNAVVWALMLFVVIGIIVVGCVLSFSLGAFVWGEVPVLEGITCVAEAFKEIYVFLKEFFFETGVFGPMFASSVILSSIEGVLSPFVGIFICYAVISFVSMIARKNRVLYVVLILIGISFARQMISGALESIQLVGLISSGDETTLAVFELVKRIIMLLITVGLGVGSFFVCKYVSEKKLNLE